MDMHVHVCLLAHCHVGVCVCVLLKQDTVGLGSDDICEPCVHVHLHVMCALYTYCTCTCTLYTDACTVVLCQLQCTKCVQVKSVCVRGGCACVCAYDCMCMSESVYVGMCMCVYTCRECVCARACASS